MKLLFEKTSFVKTEPYLNIASNRETLSNPKAEFKPTYFYQSNAGRIAPNLTKKEIKKHINVFDFKNNIDFTFFP